MDHVRDPQAHQTPFKSSWAKRLLQVLGVLPFEELDAVPLGLASGRLGICSGEVFKHSALYIYIYIQRFIRLFWLRRERLIYIFQSMLSTYLLFTFFDLVL